MLREQAGDQVRERVNISAICTKFTNKLIEEKRDDTISVVGEVREHSTDDLVPGRRSRKWHLCASI